MARMIDADAFIECLYEEAISTTDLDYAKQVKFSIEQYIKHSQEMYESNKKLGKYVEEWVG